MIKVGNISIIGTSHISRQSIEEIKKQFSIIDPEVVAVELDVKRLRSLGQKESKLDIRIIGHIGIKGFIFAWVARFVQKRLGRIVNVTPGSDMLTAVKLAKAHKKKLALIDQDIDITLKKFSKSLTWKERWNFLVDIVKSLIFPKQELKKLGLSNFDLTKVPEKELIRSLIKRVEERYPGVYKVLIKERNIIMAKRLVELSLKHDSILAVVGAGHLEDMADIIKKIKSHKIEMV
jgi:pheromone shutdown-related protein TraB